MQRTYPTQTESRRNEMDSSVDRETSLDKTILVGIHEGMTVLDCHGNNIGEVIFVYLGKGRAEAEGMQRNNAPGQKWGGVLHPNEVSDAVGDQLYASGFIRIDSHGLLAADCFAQPKHIASVLENTVCLNVLREQLYSH
jgi:hypothetical protein